MIDWTIKVADVAICFATLAGPILAVQVQKFVERSRNKRDRQISIFRTLMATRAANLSPEHVATLNIVPIEFRREKKILEAWKAYLDHLSSPGAPSDTWAEKRIDSFVDLLTAMSEFLKYQFTRAELRNEIYFPQAHTQVQSEQDIIRHGLASLFKGEIALPMDIKRFPTDPEILRHQSELQQRLISWLAGDLEVKVVMQAERRPPPAR